MSETDCAIQHDVNALICHKHWFNDDSVMDRYGYPSYV